MFEEIVLEEAGFEGAILRDAPVAIAAACFPVGNVAFGDFELEFVECVSDLGVRDVVAEHAVDHVADGVGEAGDFAVAGADSRCVKRCWWFNDDCGVVDTGWSEACGVLRVA